MSELLKLAESYYAVAEDLRRQGQWFMEAAKNLNGIADSLCKRNMAATPAKPAPAPPTPVTAIITTEAPPNLTPKGPQPGDLDYDDSQNTSASEQSK